MSFPTSFNADFLARLAHELRNPLSPLVLATDLINSEAQAHPRLHSLVEVVSRQARHLSRLVDDLQDLAQLSTGQKKLYLTRVQLQDALNAAVEQALPVLEDANMALDVQVPSNRLDVSADRNGLIRILVNLMIHVGHNITAPGKFRLSVAQDGNNAVITVHDANVIVPVRQGSTPQPATTPPDDRKSATLDVGIHVAWHLVKAHGATITPITSTDKSGMILQVCFPLLEPAEPAAPIQQDARATTSASHRILIIDDNRSASYLLSRLLTRLGQDVRTEQSAAGALKVIHQFNPHFVISDIAMPGMSGLELAQEIRHLSLGYQPVLVALTGYGDAGNRSASRLAGFDHHFTKPIDLNRLTELLQKSSPVH